MTTPPASDMQPTSGKAIGSLITGIVSPLLCVYWFIGLPAGIVAVVLGVLARKETSAGTHKGAGMAMTGIILGAIGALLGLGFAALVIFGGDAGSNALTDWICEQDPNQAVCN